MQWLMVALGGALGSVLRFALVSITPLLGTARFPLGVLLVNIIGSLCIGIAYVLLGEQQLLNDNWRQFFIAGLLGGFTTFSSFSLDILQLISTGHAFMAIIYVSASVGIGLCAAYVGCLVAQHFLH
jgi:CrcB protein